MSDDDLHKTIDGGETWTTTYDWNNQAGDLHLTKLFSDGLYREMLVT